MSPDVMPSYKKSKSCDLDGPLPPAPSDGGFKDSSSKDTISSPFVDTLNSRLADCTTWSAPFIDKETYRRLGTEILPLPTTPATPSLSFQEREAHNCVDPIKYNPSESSKESDEMWSSPFRIPGTFENNKHYIRLEDMYDTQGQERLAKAAHRFYEGTANDARRQPLGIPHSFSEGSMQYRNNQATVSSPHLNGDGTSQGFPHIRFADDNDPPILSSPRGRAITRTPSPIKNLEDIKEEASISPNVSPKRSRSPMKQLFGENGWLGRSLSMKELPSEEYRKTGIKNWGEKFKQRMVQKTEDLSKKIPTALNVHISPSKPPKSRETTKFPVSLDPDEQSKLYSEVELMICSTANQFLLNEKDANRMSFESVEKITTYWIHKNRPQVIDFRFDQATQRDLIELNVKTFRFHGPCAEDLIAIHTMLRSWKTLAKEMSVRTFCAPDSVIKKHMHDAFKVLGMLGAPWPVLFALQQMQIKAVQKMYDRETERKAFESRKFGVERRWEPPVSASPKHSGEAWGNPFE